MSRTTNHAPNHPGSDGWHAVDRCPNRYCHPPQTRLTSLAHNGGVSYRETSVAILMRLLVPCFARHQSHDRQPDQRPPQLAPGDYFTLRNSETTAPNPFPTHPPDNLTGGQALDVPRRNINLENMHHPPPQIYERCPGDRQAMEVIPRPRYRTRAPVPLKY